MKWVRLAAVPLGLVVAYLIYWYAQSPVGSGLYPARVDGAYVTDGGADYPLPVIWVRPHPFAERPPTLEFATLENKEGKPSIMNGEFRPILEWHERDRPLFLRERAVRGTLKLPFNPEGITVTGVHWRLMGGPDQHFANGPLELVKVEPPQFHVGLEASGGVYHYPSKALGHTGLDWQGRFVFLSGAANLLDVIATMPGMGRPVQGLMLKRGHNDNQFDLSGGYQPITLPHKIEGDSILYIPLPPEAKQRLKDTYFYFRPAYVVQTPDGPATILNGASEYGYAARPGWRSWVPYFIYQTKNP